MKKTIVQKKPRIKALIIWILALIGLIPFKGFTTVTRSHSSPPICQGHFDKNWVKHIHLCSPDDIKIIESMIQSDIQQLYQMERRLSKLNSEAEIGDYLSFSDIQFFETLGWTLVTASALYSMKTGTIISPLAGTSSSPLHSILGNRFFIGALLFAIVSSGVSFHLKYYGKNRVKRTELEALLTELKKTLEFRRNMLRHLTTKNDLVK